jgi:hypothetical protein
MIAETMKESVLTNPIRCWDIANSLEETIAFGLEAFVEGEGVCFLERAEIPLEVDVQAFTSPCELRDRHASSEQIRLFDVGIEGPNERCFVHIIDPILGHIRPWEEEKFKSMALASTDALTVIPVADAIAGRLCDNLTTFGGREQAGDDCLGVGVAGRLRQMEVGDRVTMSEVPRTSSPDPDSRVRLLEIDLIPRFPTEDRLLVEKEIIQGEVDFVQKTGCRVGFMGNDDTPSIVEAEAFRCVAGNHI